MLASPSFPVVDSHDDEIKINFSSVGLLYFAPFFKFSPMPSCPIREVMIRRAFNDEPFMLLLDYFEKISDDAIFFFRISKLLAFAYFYGLSLGNLGSPLNQGQLFKIPSIQLKDVKCIDE